MLGRIFSPVSHLNSVKNSRNCVKRTNKPCRCCQNTAQVGQHEGLYKAYRDLRDGDHYATLNTAQKKAVDNALRDFELSGIGLPKRNSSVTAKLLPVFLNWAISTATTSSMRRWAGPNSLPTKRSWRGCQKARWLRQSPGRSERAGRLFADAGYPKLPAGNDLLRQPGPA